MLATVLANGTMDENWALFAARISGRVPTENEARLLEASRRLWPAALGIATNRAAEIPGLPSDPKSIAAEIWEEALFSTLRTMDKLGTAKIADLDSYLFAIFSYRLNRYLARERKRQAIIDRFSRHDDLNGLNGQKTSRRSKKSNPEFFFKRRWPWPRTGSVLWRGAIVMTFHGSKSVSYLG